MTGHDPKRTVAVGRKADTPPIFGPFTFRTSALRALVGRYSGLSQDHCRRRKVVKVADVVDSVFLGPFKPKSFAFVELENYATIALLIDDATLMVKLLTKPGRIGTCSQ